MPGLSDLRSACADGLFGSHRGFAPQEVKDWWSSKNCNTHPVSSNACQTASDQFGIEAFVTWGFAPQDVKDWWVSSNCNTHPASSDTCQTASNEYAIDAWVSFGFAPQNVKDWWVSKNCNTHPR